MKSSKIVQVDEKLNAKIIRWTLRRGYKVSAVCEMVAA